MVLKRLILIISLLLPAVLVFGLPEAWSLEEQIITKAINRAAAQKASRAALWNLGYYYFFHYSPTRDMAGTIARAYEAAEGKDDEQIRILKQAARFWNDEYTYWKGHKPGDLNDRPDDPYYWMPKTDWETTLKMFPTGPARYRPKSAFTWRTRNPWGSTSKMHRARGK